MSSWGRSVNLKKSLMLLRAMRLASFVRLGCSLVTLSRGHVAKADDIYGSLSTSPERFTTYSTNKEIFRISMIRFAPEPDRRVSVFHLCTLPYGRVSAIDGGSASLTTPSPRPESP